MNRGDTSDSDDDVPLACAPRPAVGRPTAARKRPAAAAAESSCTAAKRQQAAAPAPLSLAAAAQTSGSALRCRGAICIALDDLRAGGASEEQQQEQLNDALLAALRNPCTEAAVAAIAELASLGASPDDCGALHELVGEHARGCSRKRLEMLMRALCAAGADPNHLCIDNYSPLERAVCSAGSATVAAVEALLAVGARTRTEDGWTPLHVVHEADSSDRCEIIEALLRAGADPLALNDASELAINSLVYQDKPALLLAEAMADRLRQRQAEQRRLQQELQQARHALAGEHAVRQQALQALQHESAARLRAERQLEEATTCTICREEPITTALLPCFHARYCADCAAAALAADDRCPHCRGAATGTQAIYLP